MKKIITILAAVLCFTAALNAQPRAIGGRFGFMGLEVSYEHGMGGANFVEFNGGLDLGWNNDDPGFIASGIYNFMIAQPDWCRGEWGIYAGPGAYAGYLSDRVYYDDGNYYYDNGFSIGITGQVGLEYTFWFPLQLSLDIRPYLGLHMNSYDDNLKVGTYDRGLYGFYPTLSVRYRF